MIFRLKFIPIFILMISASLFLAGCVRPVPDGEATAVPADQDTFDPNVGGGTSLDPTAAPETGGQVAPTVAPTQTETDSVADSDGSVIEEVVAEATAVVAEIEETADTVATPEPTTDTPETEQAEAATTTETATTAVNCPTEHVVQSGENLYRIGLQYGLSWVTIAQYNGITNPNTITAGQTLKIPCDGTTPPPVQPTPPPDEVITYTVQPGDNLFRISLKFGVSWVEIAEANGIVNPNEIYTGQVLKIPTSAPGPRPEFTHVVKQGETVYSISVQYGVPAVAIAEANGLQEPYVIYAGQTLIIPGNG